MMDVLRDELQHEQREVVGSIQGAMDGTTTIRVQCARGLGEADPLIEFFLWKARLPFKWMEVRLARAGGSSDSVYVSLEDVTVAKYSSDQIFLQRDLAQPLSFLSPEDAISACSSSHAPAFPAGTRMHPHLFGMKST